LISRAGRQHGDRRWIAHVRAAEGDQARHSQARPWHGSPAGEVSAGV